MVEEPQTAWERTDLTLSLSLSLRPLWILPELQASAEEKCNHSSHVFHHDRRDKSLRREEPLMDLWNCYQTLVFPLGFGFLRALISPVSADCSGDSKHLRFAGPVLEALWNPISLVLR